ncbi:MAG: hypothetical protein IKM18_03635 [Clostridia bacterium]|nr:hypothetical protein [Clostridia bacterium]
MILAKRLPISIIALMLALVFIMSSCSRVKEPEKEQTNNDITKDPFTGIFVEEAIPTIHITTPDSKEVTVKTYKNATMRLELNERYADYTSTYTDEDGGDIEIRCRGNSTYNNSDMRKITSGHTR